MISGQRSAVSARLANENVISIKTSARSFDLSSMRILLLFAFCLLPCGAAAQNSALQNSALQNSAPQNSAPSIGDATSFAYKFENPRFYVSIIEIDLYSTGAGELRFKRGESDEVIDRKLKLLPATIARIRQLYEMTRFLDSTEEYQDKKDFSHLGWISLWAQAAERKRLAKFNYTTNKEIAELSEIFRGIATQEMHLFDLETSEQYQPLDLPRLLETLENDLRLQRISEPDQLLPKLQEISNNDTQPLIARNNAKRIIDGIKKGKFKSPVKK